MGPLKRLIGSLYFLYIGGRKRRREEKKGSENLPKRPQSLLRRGQTLFQRSFLHYLPTCCLKSSVFVRDILNIQFKKMRMSRTRTLLLQQSVGR